MKKIILILALSSFTIINAQEKDANQKNKMTIEQRNQLHLKKMTLDLDLTPAQQKEVAQLIAEESTKRESKRKEMLANKENEKKLTADEKFKLQNERLDNQIAHKAKMRKILNDKQFEKWESNKEKRNNKHQERKINHRKKQIKKDSVK